MTTSQGNAPSRDAHLEALEAEQWGHVSGHDRYAVICFNRPRYSVALVPQSLAASVWQGMRSSLRSEETS